MMINYKYVLQWHIIPNYYITYQITENDIQNLNTVFLSYRTIADIKIK